MVFELPEQDPLFLDQDGFLRERPGPDICDFAEICTSLAQHTDAELGGKVVPSELNLSLPVHRFGIVDRIAHAPLPREVSMILDVEQHAQFLVHFLYLAGEVPRRPVAVLDPIFIRVDGHRAVARGHQPVKRG